MSIAKVWVLGCALLLLNACDSAPADPAVDAGTAEDSAVPVFMRATTPTLPVATGACPDSQPGDFVSGGEITVSPAGMTPRRAVIPTPVTSLGI